DAGGRHAYLSGGQSHRPRARQGSAHGGGRIARRGAEVLPAACSSLADPARTLCLHGAEAELSELSDPRSVPLRAQDAAGGEQKTLEVGEALTRSAVRLISIRWL